VGITLGRESAFEIDGDNSRQLAQDLAIFPHIEAAASLEKWLLLFDNGRLLADR
jgi:hypothetical protein